MSCTACQRLARNPLGSRVYADGLVLVLLMREPSGRRSLWVLPRSHTPTEAGTASASLSDHLHRVAKRARLALAEAGIAFHCEAATSLGNQTTGHPYLQLAETAPEDTGVHRLPPTPKRDRHLETVC